MNLNLTTSEQMIQNSAASFAQTKYKQGDMVLTTLDDLLRSMNAELRNPVVNYEKVFFDLCAYQCLLNCTSYGGVPANHMARLNEYRSVRLPDKAVILDNLRRSKSTQTYTPPSTYSGAQSMSVYGQINSTSYATAPPQVGSYPSLPQFSSTASIQPNPSYYPPPSPAPSRSTIYSSFPSSPYGSSGLYVSSTMYPAPPSIPVSMHTSMTPPPMPASSPYFQGSGYRTTYPSPAPTLPPMTITLSSPFIKAEPVHPDVLYGSYISMDEMKAHVMRQFNLTLIPDYPDLNFGKTDEVHSKSAMEVYRCLFTNTQSTSAISNDPRVLAVN